MGYGLKQFSGACKSNTVYISREGDFTKEIGYMSGGVHKFFFDIYIRSR